MLLCFQASDDEKDIQVQLAREYSWMMQNPKLGETEQILGKLPPMSSKSVDLDVRNGAVVQAPEKFGSVFEVGLGGAIHSEPPIPEERLFLGISPEKADWIEQLGKQFENFKKEGEGRF